MDIIVKNKKLEGSIRAISSKSYSQRALFISLLARGQSEIVINDLSDDIRAALAIVDKIKSHGDRKTYLDLDMGESATCLRLLIPILGVLGQNASLVRRGSLAGRPLGPFMDLLPAKAYMIREDGPRLILSGRLREGFYEIDGNISSQFISGLLLALGSLEKTSQIKVRPPMESLPYIEMTMEVMEDFGGRVERQGNTFTCGGGYSPRSYEVEGDWSSALFFLAAGCEVTGLNPSSLQADRLALDFFKDLGMGNISQNGFLMSQISEPLGERILDARHMPDAVPILSVLSARIPGRTRVINGARLRLKESDRIRSTVSMLEALGVDVLEEEDGFSFTAAEGFRPAQIDSFSDHRIAMSAAIASGFARGPIKILGADSVSKSYPGFFGDLEKLGGSYVK